MLTLQSETGESYALRRFLWAQPRWVASAEVRVLGVVGLQFRFNGYSSNANEIVLTTGNENRDKVYLYGSIWKDV